MPDVNTSLLWTGIVLGLVGILTALFRNAPKHFFMYLRRLFIVRVDIMNNDSLFEWLKVWFDKDASTQRSRLISASAVPLSEADTTKKWKILFTPAPGLHFIFFRGRPVLVNRERKDLPGADGSIIGVRDTFTFYFFTRSQRLVRDFLEEAQRIADEEKVNKLTIFTADIYQNWTILAHRDPRPLDSVILDKGVKEAVYDDIARFLASEEWYRRMSVPFHRGYLFHGPPGSGKSSLAIALASAFRMDVYLLNLNNLSDARLMNLLSNMPSHSILLLEDIDSAFTKRDAFTKLTFSGFLNALDGVHAKDGIMVFMSTNHLEQLDPALLRAGRVDHKVYLGMATAHQMQQIFLRFFPHNEEEAMTFAERLAGRQVSMAAIQEYLLVRRSSPESALREVDAIDMHGKKPAWEHVLSYSGERM